MNRADALMVSAMLAIFIGGVALALVFGGGGSESKCAQWVLMPVPAGKTTTLQPRCLRWEDHG